VFGGRRFVFGYFVYLCIADSQTPAAPTLVVRCKCGACGFEGRGASAMNFVCHCSVCRKASGMINLPAAGFKEDNVVWFNEEGIR
jgi:hypothetical protein